MFITKQLEVTYLAAEETETLSFFIGEASMLQPILLYRFAVM